MRREVFPKTMLYRGKEEVPDSGSYRCVNLLQRWRKVLERVFERILMVVVDFDEMQCGFIPAR